jgi:hypothetical protein
MRSNRRGSIRRQKFRAKGIGQEAKIQEFMYRDTMNVEHEMYGDTGNRQGHWNSNKGAKKMEAIAGKYSIEPLQKTYIHVTARIMRKVLQSKI